MKKYIAYYRVSTDRQGRSGLGLEAQRQIVEDYVSQQPGGFVLDSFTDVMSGRSERRPELHAALAAAKAYGATLIVAKLDRLARNARFLGEIHEGDVDVVFCNLPQLPPGPVGRFMVQIMASIAELESGMISDRVRGAIAAAKRRGKTWGGYRGGDFPAEVRALGRAKRTEIADEYAKQTLVRLRAFMAEGVASRAEMAARLNAEGYRTPSGRGRWCGTTVTRILDRLEAAEKREIAAAKARAREVFSVGSVRRRTGPKRAPAGPAGGEEGVCSVA